MRREGKEERGKGGESDELILLYGTWDETG